jgi:dihydroorotate dehydrogenase electron transfer subunit
MSRGIYDARVLRNHPVCREHYVLTIGMTSFPPTRPGQFLQVLCRDQDDPIDRVLEWMPGERPAIAGRDLRAHDAFLRRPFSIAGRRQTGQGVEIDLIGREVGPGTRFLARLEAGHAVNLIGPLGNTFELPPPGGIALMVGGGVGIPPMIYLAQALAEDLNNPTVERPRKGIAFCGVTTRDLLPLTEEWSPGTVDRRASTADPLYNLREFAQFNVPSIVSTDDGSYGMKGYVTSALEQYLDRWITDNADRNRTVIYTCGPEPMMKRVQELSARRSIRCQIAVERAMACGMGTCQSCVIRVAADGAKPASRFALACTDGPVFEGDRLLW